MKKIIAILFVATLVSCAGSVSTEENETLETTVVMGTSLDTNTVNLNVTISEEVTTTLTEADSSATE